MKIIRNRVNPAEQAVIENAIAETQRNADIMEYIAMMTDVEIPTEEDQYEQEV